MPQRAHYQADGYNWELRREMILTHFPNKFLCTSVVAVLVAIIVLILEAEVVLVNVEEVLLLITVVIRMHAHKLDADV